MVVSHNGSIITEVLAILQDIYPSSFISEFFDSQIVVHQIVSTLPIDCKILISRLSLLNEPTRIEPILLWFKGNQSERVNQVKKVINYCRKIKILQIITNSNAQQIPIENIQPRYIIQPKFLNSLRKIMFNVTSISNDPMQNLKAKYIYLSPILVNESISSKMEAIETIERTSRSKWINFVGFCFKKANIKSEISKCFKELPLTLPPDVLNHTLDKSNLFAQQGIPYWFLISFNAKVLCILRSFIFNVSNTKNKFILFTLLLEIVSLEICQPFKFLSDDSEEINKLLEICLAIGMLHKHEKIYYTTPICCILQHNIDEISMEEKYIISQVYSTNYKLFDDNIFRTILRESKYYKNMIKPDTVFFSDNIFSYRKISDPIEQLPLSENWINDRFGNQKLSENHVVKPSWVNVRYFFLNRRDFGDSNGLVCESNFRVFLIQPDAIEAAILESFTEIKIVTPQFVVALITRDSIFKSLNNGMTADIILKFMEMHTSRRVINFQRHDDDSVDHSKKQKSTFHKKNIRIIPENVMNQIKLWEKQKESMQMIKSCLFEFNETSEINIYPIIIEKFRNNENILFFTPIPPDVTSPNSPNFNQWKTDFFQKLNTDRTNMFFGLYDNHYSKYPIICIKIEFKKIFVNHLKEIRHEYLSKRTSVQLKQD